VYNVVTLFYFLGILQNKYGFMTAVLKTLNLIKNKQIRESKFVFISRSLHPNSFGFVDFKNDLKNN